MPATMAAHGGRGQTMYSLLLSAKHISPNMAKLHTPLRQTNCLVHVHAGCSKLEHLQHLQCALCQYKLLSFGK